MRGASSWLAAALVFVRFLRDGMEAPVEPKAEAVIIRKKRSPYIPQPGRYKSTDWLLSLSSLPGSYLLRRIKGPIICSCLSAMLACLLHSFLAPLGLFKTLGLQAHSLLGSALGLLLVFRTNTAYSRFEEGRRIWERILDSGRDLTRYAVIYRRQIGNDSAARICRLVEAFPYCMIEHLRGQADVKLRKKLERLVGDPNVGVESDLSVSTNRPLYIVNQLAATIADTRNDEGPQAMFTNRERGTMLSSVRTLSQTIGECERIVQTPVPLTYVRHTSRFLSIFIFTLPFALVSQLGSITVVVTMVASWALFGILEIGLTIEDPFRGVLKVEVVADTLERDIFETVKFLGAHELWEMLAKRGVEPLSRHSWAGASAVGPAWKSPSVVMRDDAAMGPSQVSTPAEGDMSMRFAAGDAPREDLRQADSMDGGVIDFEDFKTSLRNLDPDRWTDTRLRHVFETADTDLDGQLSLAEWHTIIRHAEGRVGVSGMPSSMPLPEDVHGDDAYIEETKSDEPEKPQEREASEQRKMVLEEEELEQREDQLQALGAATRG